MKFKYLSRTRQTRIISYCFATLCTQFGSYASGVFMDDKYSFDIIYIYI